MENKHNVIIYNIDKEYLNRTKNLLKQKLSDWYTYKGLDILVVISTLGEIGMLMIDCSNENNMQIREVAELTNLFLDEFNIDYTYEYKFLI